MPAQTKKNKDGQDIEKAFYDNGKLGFEVPVKDHKRHGLMKGYTPEGDLSYQQPYMNGLPDGAGQWFNPPTGKLMEEHIFSAGQLEAVKVFSEAGTMEEEFSFSSGINKKFTKFGQLESETPMDPQTFDILRDVVIGQFPK